MDRDRYEALSKKEKAKYHQYIRQCIEFEKTVFQYQVQISKRDVSIDEFKEALAYFQKISLDHVCEERNNEHICGYPLCNKRAKPVDIKYIESNNGTIHQENIYKNFCCDKCKTAYYYIHSQLPQQNLHKKNENPEEYDIIDMREHRCGRLED